MDKDYKLDIEDISPISTSNIIIEDNNIIVENEDYIEQKCDFHVVCDNTPDRLSFIMEEYGDDDSMTVIQNRCDISVYIKPNLTEYDKEYSLLFTHSNDIDVYKRIIFIQKAQEFKIEIDDSVNTVNFDDFDSALDEKNSDGQDGEGMYYQEHTFKVRAIGGSEKWRVRSIKKHFINEFSEETYEKFDNDFIYTIDNENFRVVSYGKPCRQNNVKYIITLCHKDNKEITNRIIISYDDNIEYNFSEETEEEKNNTVKDKELYKNEQSNGNGNNGNESKSPEITLTVEKNSLEVENNGNVKYNVVSSDGIKYACMVRSSAVWCDVSLNETVDQREINILVKNKPIVQRLSKITISVIDFPKETRDIIVKNG